MDIFLKGFLGLVERRIFFVIVSNIKIILKKVIFKFYGFVYKGLLQEILKKEEQGL